MTTCMWRGFIAGALLLVFVIGACAAGPIWMAQTDVCQATHVPLSIDTSLPDDFTDLNTTSQPDQTDLNCFAWKTFIVLSWPSDPAHRGRPLPTPTAGSLAPADFGKSGDNRSTVWQSYKPVSDVFREGAASPLPWLSDDEIPDGCSGANGPVLRMISKFGAGLELPPQDAGRRADVAAASTPISVSTPVITSFQVRPDILVDQAGKLVRYEQRINEVEYDYVTTNHLYDADQQYSWARIAGILPPPSDAKGVDGSSIEIKAAWRQLDGARDDIQKRYWTTPAWIYDPVTQKCSGPTTMGLVGLHIVRKTALLQQWMWATFEQVDNVPGGTNHPTDVPYSFHNPTCTVLLCAANATPLPTATPPGTPTLVPVQVERMVPIPTDVVDLNLQAQAKIRAYNPDSVWQYYQLINAAWPALSKLGLPRSRTTVPLDLSPYGFTSAGSTPAATPRMVSNVVLETYDQDKDCTTCHRYAAIAPSASTGCKPNLTADFSFNFRHAQRATPPPVPTCTPTP